MYDPTMHAKTLSRHIRKADFKADKNLATGTNLEVTIQRAVQIGKAGFASLQLRKNTLRGKSVYQLGDLAETLVVRHITSNIRRVTGVKQDNRQFIVSCMQKLLRDGTPFRVYKFDVESFYESVSAQGIINRLEADTAFSGQSIRALRSLFIQLDAAGVSGIPRGLSLSATLAEYLLRDFDTALANTSGVWFYARFVDDIAIITDGREDAVEFVQLAAERLPTGLRFNKKSRVVTFAPMVTGNGAAEEDCFDFLGYRFSVGLARRNKPIDNTILRDTWLDVSPSKVRKLKSRIAQSLLDFRRNGNFLLLRSRIRLLTSNFKYIDITSGRSRASGIYYNYPLVDDSRSTALRELDRYLVSALTSPHARNRLKPSLTAAQRAELLNLRFVDGFAKRRFFAFSPTRLAQLTECWAYA